MSSDYYGAQAGEIADEGSTFFDSLTEGQIAEYFADRDRDNSEPPDWYLEMETERHAGIHRRKDHGGGVCDCLEGGPEIGEAPF